MQKWTIFTTHIACREESVERGEHDAQRVSHNVQLSPPLRHNSVDGVLYTSRRCILLISKRGRDKVATPYCPSLCAPLLPKRTNVRVRSQTR